MYSDIEFRVWGLGLRVQGLGLGFRVQGLGFRVQGSGFRLYRYKEAQALSYEFLSPSSRPIKSQDPMKVSGFVEGLGFRIQVQGLGFRVQGVGFRVQGLGFRVQAVGQGLGSRVQGLGVGFRVQGLGLRFRDEGVRFRVVPNKPYGKGSNNPQHPNPLTKIPPIINPKPQTKNPNP